MVRPFMLIAGLALGTVFTGSGCRSCSSCHDYDAPVANCDCNACGTRRAGSNSGGYVNGEYGEYVEEGQIIEGEASSAPIPEPPTQEVDANPERGF